MGDQEREILNGEILEPYDSGLDLQELMDELHRPQSMQTREAANLELTDILSSAYEGSGSTALVKQLVEMGAVRLQREHLTDGLELDGQLANEAPRDLGNKLSVSLQEQACRALSLLAYSASVIHVSGGIMQNPQEGAAPEISFATRRVARQVMSELMFYNILPSIVKVLELNRTFRTSTCALRALKNILETHKLLCGTVRKPEGDAEGVSEPLSSKAIPNTQRVIEIGSSQENNPQSVAGSTLTVPGILSTLQEAGIVSTVVDYLVAIAESQKDGSVKRSTEWMASDVVYDGLENAFDVVRFLATATWDLGTQLIQAGAVDAIFQNIEILLSDKLCLEYKITTELLGALQALRRHRTAFFWKMTKCDGYNLLYNFINLQIFEDRVCQHMSKFKTDERELWPEEYDRLWSDIQEFRIEMILSLVLASELNPSSTRTTPSGSQEVDADQVGMTYE